MWKFNEKGENTPSGQKKEISCKISEQKENCFLIVISKRTGRAHHNR